MSQKKAKLHRKLMGLPSLTSDQQKQLGKIFKERSKRNRVLCPKDLPVHSKKMHKDESIKDFQERRRKTNRRKRKRKD